MPSFSVFFNLLPSQLNSNLGHPSLIFEEKKRFIISSSLSCANSTTFTYKSILCLVTLQISLSLSLSLSLSPSLSCPSLPVYQSFSLSVCLFFQHCTLFLSTYWWGNSLISPKQILKAHTHLQFSLRCACCCLLEVSPVSLVVLAIRLALFFIVTHTHTYTRAHAFGHQCSPFTIVYSHISGPQTFSDFFYIMKVCEETVLCS